MIPIRRTKPPARKAARGAFAMHIFVRHKRNMPHVSQQLLSSLIMET